jgi:protocatechuate 3,4-dioxygenase beta subunit
MLACSQGIRFPLCQIFSVGWIGIAFVLLLLPIQINPPRQLLSLALPSRPGKMHTIAMSKIRILANLMVNSLFCLTAIFGARAQSNVPLPNQVLVLDATTLKPIAGAHVEFCSGDNGRMMVSVCREQTTDLNGHAELTTKDIEFSYQQKLKSGKTIKNTRHFSIDHYAVKVDGYLNEYYYRDVRSGASIAQNQLEPVVVAFLQPASSIAGKVVDANGNPLSGVELELKYKNQHNGKIISEPYTHLAPPQWVITDTNGAFSYSSISAGEFAISLDVNIANRNKPSNLSKFLPANYPSDRNEFLCIGPGEHRVVSIQLQQKVLEPFSSKSLYSVSFKLIRPSNINPYNGPLIGLYREDGSLVSSYKDSYNVKTGILELSSLLPGIYSAEISTGINETDAKGRIKFEVKDHDLILPDVMLLLAKDDPLHGHVNLEAQVKLPAGFKAKTDFSLLLTLDPDGPAPLEDSGQPIQKNSTLIFKDNKAGHYRLRLINTDEPVYIGSATLDGNDILAKGFDLSNKTRGPLQIELATASGSLRGRVLDADNKPYPNADIKLLLKGQDTDYVFRSTVSNFNGEYALAGVPPGDYKILALKSSYPDFRFGLMEVESTEELMQPVKIENSSNINLNLPASVMKIKTPVCK